MASEGPASGGPWVPVTLRPLANGHLAAATEVAAAFLAGLSSVSAQLGHKGDLTVYVPLSLAKAAVIELSCMSEASAGSSLASPSAAAGLLHLRMGK